jgi:hypothetical protein
MGSVLYRRGLILVVMGTLVALALAASPAVTEAEARSGGDGSGGPAVAHHAGGARIAAKGPDAKLFRPIVDGIPMQAGEPTLGVTNEGNVFYVTLAGAPDIIRSDNNGESWTNVSPTFPNGGKAHRVSFDPYIYVDDAEGVDRIFTIDLTVACAYLSFSDDEGKSWVTNPLACGRPVNDHQTLFSGPAAVSPTPVYPNVVYYCWNDIGSSSCTKSLDGGLTFVSTGSPAFPGADPLAETPSYEPENPTDVGSFCGGLHGHGHVGLDGTVYLPKGHCGQPWLAISTTEGATWERVQVAENGMAHHEASVATDRKGNIYYAWSAADRLIYLSISKDGGRKWSKPMMIGAPGVNETNLPSLDVGEPGQVAIAYMGSENSPGRPFPESPGSTTNPDCFVAQLPCPPPDEYKDTTWNGYVTITKNALDKNPTFFSTTVNDKKDPFKRGTCGPGRCGLDILDFIDITIAPDGQVWSAWVDACISVCSEPKGQQDQGSEAVVGRLVPNVFR